MTTPATDANLARIGDAIRDARERLGLYQTDVAKRSTLSIYHYRDIENGRVQASRRSYLLIADVLDIPIDEMDALINGSAA
jgi:transcriptional regulator with XRE-family HTH domain